MRFVLIVGWQALSKSYTPRHLATSVEAASPSSAGGASPAQLASPDNALASPRVGHAVSPAVGSPWKGKEQQDLAVLLQHMRNFVTASRRPLAAWFARLDTDETGIVDRTDFRTTLPFGVSEDEFELLSKAYATAATGFRFNYRQLSDDVGLLSPGPAVRVLDFTGDGDEEGEERDLGACIRLASFLNFRGLRLRDFLVEHDRARHGYVSRTSFANALTLAGYMPPEKDLEALVEANRDASDPCRIHYLSLCARLEHDSPMELRERAPSVATEQDALAREADEARSAPRLAACMARLRARVAAEGLPTKAVFADFDRVHRGAVEAEHVLAALERLGLREEVDEDEVALMCVAFRHADAPDLVNHLALTAELEPPMRTDTAETGGASPGRRDGLPPAPLRSPSVSSLASRASSASPRSPSQQGARALARLRTWLAHDGVDVDVLRLLKRADASRDGVIPRTRFQSLVASLGPPIMPVELEAIADAFTTRGNAIDYTTFAATLQKQ